MSKLEDMEELIFKVINKDFKPTLQEIVSCYNARAYRACIVLSFNVLVDDLVEKIKHLKDTNSELKEIYKEIISKNKDSTPIENYLVESLVSKNLIDNLDGELYTMFQKLRHKSAHPTGFNPSAECARYIFSEIINRFLSKPTLKTTSRIDELLENLSSEDFFSNNKISDMTIIARKEISDIAPSSFPQLIHRLYKKYSQNDDVPDNPYLKFIYSMSRIGNDELNSKLSEIIIEKKSSVSGNNTLFMSLLSCSPIIFSDIDKATASRIFKKIQNSAIQRKSTHHNSLGFSNPFLGMINILNETNGELGNIIYDNIDIIFKSSNSLTLFIKKIDMSKKEHEISYKSYLAVYEKIIKKINENDAETIINSIKNSGNKVYDKMHGRRLIRIIGNIIQYYDNDGDKISEFLMSIYDNNKAIINRINKYTTSENLTMEKIKEHNPDIHHETFFIIGTILGIEYPDDTE